MEVKYRTVVVKNLGKFQVPTHVFRVDLGSHGWSARVINQGKRFYEFFSDANYKGAKNSLKAASMFAEKHRPRIRVGGRLNTGTGIRLVRITRTSRPLGDHYVVIPKLTKGIAAHRIYIGNDHTISEARYRAAMQEAKLLRQRFVDDYMEMKNEQESKRESGSKKAATRR
jgi:hypothetical protein